MTSIKFRSFRTSMVPRSKRDTSGTSFISLNNSIFTFLNYRNPRMLSLALLVSMEGWAGSPSDWARHTWTGPGIWLNTGSFVAICPKMLSFQAFCLGPVMRIIAVGQVILVLLIAVLGNLYNDPSHFRSHWLLLRAFRLRCWLFLPIFLYSMLLFDELAQSFLSTQIWRRFQKQILLFLHFLLWFSPIMRLLVFGSCGRLGRSKKFGGHLEKVLLLVQILLSFQPFLACMRYWVTHLILFLRFQCLGRRYGAARRNICTWVGFRGCILILTFQNIFLIEVYQLRCALARSWWRHLRGCLAPDVSFSLTVPAEALSLILRARASILWGRIILRRCTH